MADNFPLTRFLLVDDNPIDIMISTLLLERSQLVSHIDTAENGLQALAYLEACQKSNQYPEVILLDLNMPLVNGHEFLKECFEKGLLRERSVKIVVLTSSIYPPDEQKVYDYPVAGYLNKPLQLDRLRTILQSPDSKSQPANS